MMHCCCCSLLLLLYSPPTEAAAAAAAAFVPSSPHFSPRRPLPATTAAATDPPAHPRHRPGLVSRGRAHAVGGFGGGGGSPSPSRLRSSEIDFDDGDGDERDDLRCRSTGPHRGRAAAPRSSPGRSSSSRSYPDDGIDGDCGGDGYGGDYYESSNPSDRLFDPFAPDAFDDREPSRRRDEDDGDGGDGRRRRGTRRPTAGRGAEERGWRRRERWPRTERGRPRGWGDDDDDRDRDREDRDLDRDLDRDRDRDGDLTLDRLADRPQGRRERGPRGRRDDDDPRWEDDRRYAEDATADDSEVDAPRDDDAREWDAVSWSGTTVPPGSRPGGGGDVGRGRDAEGGDSEWNGGRKDGSASAGRSDDAAALGTAAADDKDKKERQREEEESRGRGRYGEYETYFKEDYVSGKSKKKKKKKKRRRSGEGGRKDFLDGIGNDFDDGLGLGGSRDDPYGRYYDDRRYERGRYDDRRYEDGYNDYDRYDRLGDHDIEEEEEIEPEWEWETTPSGGASVLLPPLDALLQRSPPPPKSILHFIGGTIFGSYPTRFYGPLLTEIARQTSSVVVVTPVPVTLNRNPLNHLALGETIVDNFREAYYEIVCDEYAAAAASNDDAEGGIGSVPIVGIGHSLGARLHVVINTDQRLSRGALEREGNVLIGFNNYGAVQSVPGVKTLRRGVKDVDRTDSSSSRSRSMRSGRGSEALDGRGRRDWDWYWEKEEEYSNGGKDDALGRERVRNEGQRRGGYDNDDDDINDGLEKDGEEMQMRSSSKARPSPLPRRQVRRSDYDTYEEYARARDESRNRGRRRRRRSREDDYYDYDDDDDDDLMEEVDELFSLVSDSIRSRFDRVKSALTPADLRADGNLEFRPSPDELWSEIRNGSYGAKIGKTLIVQFEGDGIDQGARMARSVVESSAVSSQQQSASSPPSPVSRVDGDDSVGGDDEEADGKEGSTTSAESDGFPTGGSGSSSSSSSSSSSPSDVDVKFARLSGTHLTPVSYGDGLGVTRAVAALSGSPLSFDAVLGEMMGEEQRGRNRKGAKSRDGGVGKRREEREMEDLAASIVRYIEDVICVSV